MAIANGFDERTGERAFIFGSPYDEKTKGFFEDVWASPAGQRFRSEFRSPDNNLRAVDEAQRRFGHAGYVTASQFSEVLGDLMAGDPDFRPNEDPESVVETPAPIEEVPVDRNGKRLGASQLAWAEMTRWSQTASSRDISERRKIDPAFASFYRKNLEREMAEAGGAEEAVKPVGTATPELIQFAVAYRNTPADEVRKLKRADYNPFGYQEFNRNVDAAIAAGLV